MSDDGKGAGGASGDPATTVTLAAPLGRMFHRVCQSLEREVDDVFSEMLEHYLQLRGLAPERVATDKRPADPAAQDPREPHHCPMCRNAHRPLAERRTAKRVGRLRQLLDPATDDPADPRAARRPVGAAPLPSAPPPVEEVVRHIEEHRRSRPQRLQAALGGRRHSQPGAASGEEEG